MKALARRPEDRYSGIAAMKLDLLRFMRGGGNFATIRVTRGAHVIRQGEVGDAAYIVVSGKLEVYKHIDDERVPLRTLGPGDMFGETAIFAASPRTASVVVLEDASLVVVTSEVIEQELASMKPWMGAFIRTLASRFGGIEEERRARGHSGPSVSALSVVRPAPSAASSTSSAGFDTAAVYRDRSDITVVADLMAEDSSMMGVGDSVMIDVSSFAASPRIPCRASRASCRAVSMTSRASSICAPGFQWNERICSTSRPTSESPCRSE